MSNAQEGNKVKIHFKGSLENGEVFADSHGQDPLEFTIGSGEILPDLEKAVVGMEQGESKDVTISPDGAYGPRREELVVDVDKTEFPEHISPAVGEKLQIQTSNEETVLVEVKEVGEEAVTLDANHPLAGETLHFSVELVEIAG
ncbi:MAG: peptidylprolyl isomerase [bacterium]